MKAWQEMKDAPKEERHFLCKRPDGLVTTAYYYWYTESAIIDGQDLAFWALQDAVTNELLAEDGYDEEYRWMPLPE